MSGRTAGELERMQATPYGSTIGPPSGRIPLHRATEKPLVEVTLVRVLLEGRMVIISVLEIIFFIILLKYTLGQL